MEAREGREVPPLRVGKVRRRSGRDDREGSGERKERSLDCARDDREERDPSFQKPKTKGRGTPSRKNKFKIAFANWACASRRRERKKEREVPRLRSG